MANTAETLVFNLSGFGKALSDPSRQQIMELCCCQWKNVSELVALTGLAQSTVSHHLAVLCEAGLVHLRHEGKKAFYTLNQQAIYQCCQASANLYAPEVISQEENNKEGNE